jgi:hypothetical protein
MVRWCNGVKWKDFVNVPKALAIRQSSRKIKKSTKRIPNKYTFNDLTVGEIFGDKFTAFGG